MNIDFPKITAQDERGQLAQIKSYLHRLVEQLNFATQAVSAQMVSTQAGDLRNPTDGTDGTADTFASIKALIIKSADIVNAYYDEINKRLEGVYVAESYFGTYAEQTTLGIQANANSIRQLFSNVARVISDVEEIENSVAATNAYINAGLLYYDENGLPVYGLEIGQKTVVDGIETFNRYARFVVDRLSFYDENDNEVAYISDQQLYIREARITVSLRLGNLLDVVRPDMSVVTKYGGDM